jgi:hypothetical protein
VISYALASAMYQGHCGLPTKQLLTLAAELLEAPLPLISDALKAEFASGDVVFDSVRDKPCTHARELLEFTRSPIDIIAERVGHGCQGLPPRVPEHRRPHALSLP